MAVKTKTKYSVNRRYEYVPRLRFKYLKDEFGEPYYLHDPNDEVVNYSVSLPKSLMVLIDQERKKAGNTVTRSRFIRKALEEKLGIKRIII